MKHYYETERLILKVIDKNYAEDVVKYYLRNREFLEEWEPIKSKEFYKKEHQEKAIEKELVLCLMKVDFIELKLI
jgi:hypothetical protein